MGVDGYRKCPSVRMLLSALLAPIMTILLMPAGTPTFATETAWPIFAPWLPALQTDTMTRAALYHRTAPRRPSMHFVLLRCGNAAATDFMDWSEGVRVSRTRCSMWTKGLVVLLEVQTQLSKEPCVPGTTAFVMQPRDAIVVTGGCDAMFRVGFLPSSDSSAVT